MNVYMAAVRATAGSSPENDVSPNVIRVFPHDAHLDKILAQKATSSADDRNALEEAAA